mmetsp:Transcript_152144/g.486145  ORF Transcript_152144/g.486145 Transcript_152144/m.486145 type:complete len:225 (+) Transcript_152144:80-754(+)
MIHSATGCVVCLRFSACLRQFPNQIKVCLLVNLTPPGRPCFFMAPQKKNKGRKAPGGVAAAGLDDLGSEARRLLLEDLGGDMDLAEDDAAIAVEGEAISAEGAAALVPGQAVDAVAGEPVFCKICTRPVSAEDTCRQGRGVTGYVVHKFCRNAKSGVMRTATTDEEKKSLEVFAASNPAEFGEHLSKVCGQSGRWGAGNTALAKALIEEISSFTKACLFFGRSG